MATKFVLIGSGLAGGLLAAYLGRRGYEVELYERRADPREGNIVGGRSINLALSTRGIHALEQLGIADEVLKHAIETGELILAVRTREPGDKTFGIAIFEAKDEAAARAFMESDPAVVAGLMTAELHPFAVALQRRNP